MSSQRITEMRLAESMANQKLSEISAVLEKMLGKLNQDSDYMTRGQIKRAARYTIRKLGHQWLLKEEVHNLYFRHRLTRGVKNFVKNTVGLWHKDPNRVWLQFRKHCMEIAAAHAAREMLTKFRLDPNGAQN